jgi:glycosyltransferase involved in cell wall biosynthesis
MISVVIPVYQKARHIERALKSALGSLAEACADFEIIVVDDGSTDGSGEIARSWIDASHRTIRARVISQDNRGVSAARNAGWRSAEGDLVLFLDADDEWTISHVGEILELAEQFPQASLMTTAWSMIRRDGCHIFHQFGIGADLKGLLPCFFRAMSTGPMPVSSSNAAVPMWALKQTGGFPDGVTHGEDTVAWGKLALLGPVAYSPQVGAVWHQDADNRSDVGKPISANYMLFLESALKLDWLTDEMREGIWINRDIEAARTAGLMPLYFHDSPERIDAMTAEAKAMLIEIRDRFADQLVPSIEAESHSLPAMNY